LRPWHEVALQAQELEVICVTGDQTPKQPLKSTIETTKEEVNHETVILYSTLCDNIFMLCWL